MDTARKASVPALRILTYTIVMKAVLSAVMFICTMTTWFSLRSAATDIPRIGVIYAVVGTLGFINTVACVMCLMGIARLSGKFVKTYRLMVAGLILQCVMLLLSTAGIGLTLKNDETAVTAVNILLLASEAVEKMLSGAAVLYCMKGFGEVLREDGDTVSAVASERLGVIYFYLNMAGILLQALTLYKAIGILLPVSAVFYLLEAVLEFLTYLRASDAAFRTWRRRAFDVSE